MCPVGLQNTQGQTRYPETFQVVMTESEIATKKFSESGYKNAAVCHQAQ
jgi:hypothetical protein